MSIRHQLNSKKCKSCEGETDRLSREEVKKLLAQLNNWQLKHNKEIVKTFTFKNYFRVMSFVNAIAHIVNQENHHPDLEVSYNKCTVHFSTHSINGLSKNDFICASKVDKLISWRPSKSSG
jgi:4a-hydroxytetrahydrobiopterin dehydratase